MNEEFLNSIKTNQTGVAFNSEIPNDSEGAAGDIRTGINYNGKRMIAVKFEDDWYFATMDKLKKSSEVRVEHFNKLEKEIAVLKADLNVLRKKVRK